MSDGVKSRRAYESPRRREQASRTRRDILEAARDLFVARGYVATTIEQISARATVSSETVYALFTTKRALLTELVDISIRGDDSPLPILDQPWVASLTAERDPARRLEILANAGASILGRRSAIDEVVHAAAAADPQIAALWQRGRTERLAGQRELLAIVMSAGGPWAVDLAAATDILYAIGSPEIYRLLVEDRGWGHAEFAEWYSRTLKRLLLM